MTSISLSSPLIICGFPGVGKTHFASTVSKDILADGAPILTVPRYNLAISARVSDTVLCDSDSSTFDKAQFPGNYLSAISQVATFHPKSIQLVSTHDVVLAGLKDLKLPHTVVRPSIELKDLYLQRYRDRGSPEAFCALIDKMWDRFIKDIITHCLATSNANEIVLGPDEYLSSPRVVKSLFRLG